MQLTICSESDRAFVDRAAAQDAGVNLDQAVTVDLPVTPDQHHLYLCVSPGIGATVAPDREAVRALMIAYDGLEVRPIRIVGDVAAALASEGAGDATDGLQSA